MSEASIEAIKKKGQATYDGWQISHGTAILQSGTLSKIRYYATGSAIGSLLLSPPPWVIVVRIGNTTNFTVWSDSKPGLTKLLKTLLPRFRWGPA